MTSALGSRAIAATLLLTLTLPGLTAAQPPPLPLPSDRPTQDALTPSGPRPPPGYRFMTEDEIKKYKQKRFRPYTILGFAGVLAVGGVTFGLVSRGQVNQAKREPYQGLALDDLNRAQTNARVANLFFAGAGLFSVGAVVAYFLRPPPLPQPPIVPLQPWEVAR
jgi:hypothetical protein